MTILPMMRGDAVVLILATAMLVQGCSTPAPMQTSQAPVTAPYSGSAWYVDLDHTMTTDSGGGN